ncbi:MAG: alkaline phosphatase family protein [Lentisphaerae bacterium]|nr:alkaline phosphatase family protein [Lentisphaerota bacterium]
MYHADHNNDELPRFLLIHLDGLSYTELNRAIAERLTPAIARFVSDNAALMETYSLVPTNTLNFFLRLLADPAAHVVGSRWQQRTTGRTVDIRHAGSLHRIETQSRVSRDGPFDNALLFGTLLGAKAYSAGMVVSNRTWGNILRTIRILSSSFLPVFFSSPMGWSNAAVVGRIDAMGARSIAAAMRSRQHTVVYICLSQYDQYSHKHGLRSSQSDLALQACDGLVDSLLQCANNYGYLPLLFSDHGLAPSSPFSEIAGKELKDVLKLLCPNSVCKIFPSGNLAHVYIENENNDLRGQTLFNVAQRVSEIDEIGLVIAKIGSEQSVFFKSGEEIDASSVCEKDARLAPALRRLAGHRDSGDLLLFGAIVNDRAVNFMHQRACHNGWSLSQTQSFLAGRIALPTDNERDIVKLLLRATSQAR